MDTQENPIATQYKQVTVEVPEDRVAEFHAFFGRFLAGRRPGRGRRRRHRRHGRYGRPHGPRCGERREATEQDEATGQATPTTEV